MSDGRTASGRVAVLVTGYGEPEDHESFRAWNELSFRHLVQKFARIPDAIIPFLAGRAEKKVRKEWMAAGGFTSPHNEIFESQRAGIERNLRERFGDAIEVFKAFSFTPEHLPQRVIEHIRGRGHDRLVLYPFMVVDSVYTSGVTVEQVNAALGGGWPTDMRYLPAFDQREEFRDRLAAHVVEGTQPLLQRFAPSQIGVILTIHGLPVKTRGWETGFAASQALYEGVRDRLMTRFPLLSIGWMNHNNQPGEWTSPDVAVAAERLITLGARAIVFAPIGFVTDNHETILDIGYLRTALEGRVETVALTSLNDDPAFLKMAADWIAPLVEELR
ncbi:MAG: ferrochelatase [Actinomycetota bacterium]